MKTASGTTLIENGQLIDGTGVPASQAPRLSCAMAKSFMPEAGGQAGVPPDVVRIDAGGGTIMPGLVKAHFHPTYFDVAELQDLDIKYPVEYVTLLAASNARLALNVATPRRSSGGSLFNIDVWLKKAIEEELTPGPRLAASGREIAAPAD